MAASFPRMPVNAMSKRVLVGRFSKLFAKRSKTRRCAFHLARARSSLFAALPDVLYGLHHVLEADLLLVGSSHNLLKRLHALLDTGSHFPCGGSRLVRQPFAQLDAFYHLFGKHHGAVDPLLDVAQDGLHLYGGFFRLVSQVFDLTGDHGKASSMFPGGGGLDG